jgi:glucokinase
MILVGDIGGTKIRLAVFSRVQGALVRQNVEKFDSKASSGLTEVINNYIRKYDFSPERACFGVPGPVINGVAQVTNLPWIVSEHSLLQETRIPSVKVVNDLQATAAAIPYLVDEDIEVLHPGKGKIKSFSNIYGLIAPGTGLGQGFLLTNADTIIPFASEGGHTDFAPINEEQIALLKYLQTRYEHVSYERILCGPGIVNIFEFLKDTGTFSVPADLLERLHKGDTDPAAVISASGIKNEYEITSRALDIFASVLGAQAGNLVLTMLTTGGIFLGGGIPQRIIEKLRDGTVVKSYLSKGRLSPVVASTQLAVIKDDSAALLGAAHIAETL